MEYEIGDRVSVILDGPQPQWVRERKDEIERSGTVVAMPGGVVYNVELDDPPDPNIPILTAVHPDRLSRAERKESCPF